MKSTPKIPNVPSTFINTYLTGRSTNVKDQQTTGSLPPGLQLSLVSMVQFYNVRNQSTVTLLPPMSAQLMFLRLTKLLQTLHHTVGQSPYRKWQFHTLGGSRMRKTPKEISLASCRAITRLHKVEAIYQNFFCGQVSKRSISQYTWPSLHASHFYLVSSWRHASCSLPAPYILYRCF